MKELRKLFQNNLEWVASRTAEKPNYFKELAKDQNPRYLWIGCSDSRVPANEIVGLEPGDIFVHRNVANICPHTDFNCLSALEFGVNILKIPHIIVCGHYGCGGVMAAMEDHHLGLVDNWLRNIRDIYAHHKEELDQIRDPKKRSNRLVELNVIQQVLNICHTTIIQEAWFRNQPLIVHGWIYDMESGKLKDLNVCISAIDQVEPIYRVQIRPQP
ncbi:MAG: carbonate dehydratase [Parachlamydiales bacterium]|nr:carbonate dehydratase [Parachlamydiales bacterium]